jgi:hypothetical protein
VAHFFGSKSELVVPHSLDFAWDRLILAAGWEAGRPTQAFGPESALSSVEGAFPHPA